MKATTEIEFDSIDELIEVGVQVGLILNSERDAISKYLKIMYKNGYFIDATDIKIKEDEICVPLTLKGLIGLLKQREKEIANARKKYRKLVKVEIIYDHAKLDIICDELTGRFHVSKEDIIQAVKDSDFNGLCNTNRELKFIIPLIKNCLSGNSVTAWYKKSCESINEKATDLTKHTPEWVQNIKNAIK